MSADLSDLLGVLTPEELAELDALLASDPTPWYPLPGPQTMAYNSQADIVGYGGAAGSGKSAVICGKALTQHKKSIIIRQESTQLTGIIDEFTAIVGNRDGFNGSEKIWRLPGGRQIEFGSLPNPGDELRYQGRPHDFAAFDEAANLREAQVRFLLGWLRTTDPNQRCQAILCFNPPSTVEGRWVIPFFGPWLDRKHPNPAQPGELRWFASVDGKEVEVDGPEPFRHGPDIIKPMSRTFIPARITDNPYLLNTGYMTTLQSLPEPLRSQLLYGSFEAGMADDIWQVIPTAWVQAAMDRWRKPDVLPQMTSLGVDVARGGKDSTVIARRHGNFFDVPLTYPGRETPDGHTVAGLVMAAVRDDAPIHIDVIGVGSSPYDVLNNLRVQVLGVNVAEAATGLDKSGRLRFKNLRSELVWRMREALEPDSNQGIALPPDPQLLSDLCSFTWSLSGSQVYVSSREEVIKRIGRSPDLASAYFLAMLDTPRIGDIMAIGGRGNPRRSYDPIDRL